MAGLQFILTFYFQRSGLSCVYFFYELTDIYLVLSEPCARHCLLFSLVVQYPANNFRQIDINERITIHVAHITATKSSHLSPVFLPPLLGRIRERGRRDGQREGIHYLHDDNCRCSVLRSVATSRFFFYRHTVLRAQLFLAKSTVLCGSLSFLTLPHLSAICNKCNYNTVAGS